ncbi:nucleotide-binding domain containing protein [Prescottella equi]|uniref:nucleotide-binding domain containing protein n=1 Tax=Rhodococcus hoagii TaxID=43767 RepID=UPI003B80B62C
MLAGSASRTTKRQVTHARTFLPHFKLEVEDLVVAQAETLGRIREWACRCWAEEPLRPVLVYSVDTAADVTSTNRLGFDPGTLLETAFAELAVDFVGAGVRQLIIAGGETSGAVVQKLSIPALDIGPQIASGIAWASGRSKDIALNLALKSGNFGSTDMFVSAWEALR